MCYRVPILSLALLIAGLAMIEKYQSIVAVVVPLNLIIKWRLQSTSDINKFML